MTEIGGYVLGTAEGSLVGSTVGTTIGLSDCFVVGIVDSTKLGTADGKIEGAVLYVDLMDGAELGLIEGPEVGEIDFNIVGSKVG